MKGGTLLTLCKEDKAKIGLLYKQLLQEREEKQEILENYNYEKEKFEQIIDLLQHQKELENKIKASSQAIYPQKSDKNLNKNANQRAMTDNSESLNPIPFLISPRSGNKNYTNFQSPMDVNRSKKSDLASPVEYIGQVFNDIKKLKGELSKMQNNIQNLVFSPERSAERRENVAPNKMRNRIASSHYKDDYQSPCERPELTLDDLDTHQRAANRKNKVNKKRRDSSVSSIDSESSSGLPHAKSCHWKNKDNHKNSMKQYKDYAKYKSQRNTKNLRKEKEHAIKKLEKLSYYNDGQDDLSDENSESEFSQSSTSVKYSTKVNKSQQKKKLILRNKLFGLYKRAAKNSVKISQKYTIEHTSRSRIREFEKYDKGLYPSVTQIENLDKKMSQNCRYDDEHVIINSQYVDQTTLSVEQSRDNRANDSLYNIISKIEENFKAANVDTEVLPVKMGRNK